LPAGACGDYNVVTVTGEVGWREMELGAPEIAQLGMGRLNAARVALLGTVRPDGSPRISPVEPYFAAGRLIVGSMAWSKKAADLRRDPRYVLHSAVTGPDSGEEELKLYGSAVEVGQDLRAAAPDAWWQAWPAEKAAVFCLRIARAVAIEWDTDRGLMTVHQWSPRDGYSKVSRNYP
jgi:Pyridoxamine 5'-phosphate oxidase